MMTSRTSSGLRELENLYKLLPYFTRSGFTPFLPEFDSGIDFIACRESAAGEGDVLIKVQLKGRWTIDKKYRGRSMAIAFPDEQDWYVIPHGEMVAFAEQAGFTNTKSWDQGTYSVGRLGSTLRQHSERWRLCYDNPTNNEAVWQGLAQGQS